MDAFTGCGVPDGEDMIIGDGGDPGRAFVGGEGGRLFDLVGMDTQRRMGLAALGGLVTREGGVAGHLGEWVRLVLREVDDGIPDPYCAVIVGCRQQMVVLRPAEGGDSISAMDISEQWPAQGLLRCRIPELNHAVFADGGQEGFLVSCEGCDCAGRKKTVPVDGCADVMFGYGVEDV